MLSTVLACSSRVKHHDDWVPNDPAGEYKGDEDDVLSHTITIDDRFTEEETYFVVDAIDEWRLATNYLFDPSIIIGHAEDDQHFAVVIMEKDHHLIMDFEEAHEYKVYLLGMVIYRTSYLAVDRLTSRNFKSVAMHEIGHYIGIPHVDDSLEDVMKPTNPSPACVSSLDLVLFCDYWNCTEQQEMNFNPTCF